MKNKANSSENPAAIIFGLYALILLSVALAVVSQF